MEDGDGERSKLVSWKIYDQMSIRFSATDDKLPMQQMM